MTALVGNAEVQMWGRGCEAAPLTRIAIEPAADGWFLEIEVAGVRLWDRAAASNDAHGVLALDATESEQLLALLLGDRAGSTEADFGMTGIGVIRMRLPLDSGDRERVIDDERMMPIAEAILELVHRAGLPTNDLLHPTGRC